MRAEHINGILGESVDSGKGGRAKNLKAYIRFYSPAATSFETERRSRISGGRENEFQLDIEGNVTFFDEWPWGIVGYHALDEEGTNKYENFIKDHLSLRIPWISKAQFETLRDSLTIEGGRIVNQRSLFEPYNDYSGYGLSLQVHGFKTKEVMDEIERNYAIHPKRIGVEMGIGEEMLKFELTNRGRLSFSRGSIESMILIIGRYVEFLKRNDDNYDFTQARTVEKEGIVVRDLHEIVKINMPSIVKIRGTRNERNMAIIDMLTGDGGALGYIGIPIGRDRASVLDLEERKMFQLTIIDDELYIYSENPSQARATIRKLFSRLASYIDPDIQLEKVPIG